ncbi:MAG: hypothetical protein N2235_17540 [Fischerella sp.]|nr:hypothetical protein [Fischerella sp.]
MYRLQAAIAPPPETLATLQVVQVITAFPQETQFPNPWETTTELDRFADGLDPQELQVYSKFLEMPNTDIFPILPDSIYHLQLNALSNRLQPSLSKRYLFSPLG